MRGIETSTTIRSLGADTRRRAGMVILAVIVLSSLGAMVVVSLLFSVRTEQLGAAASRGSRQAQLAAMSGVHRAAQVLSEAFDRPSVWWDNPGLFRERLVHDDGVDRWYFTVFSPRDVDDDGSCPGLRHGLTDESAKFNVPMVDRRILESLPGMDGRKADALLDYVDAGDETRKEGAEQDYYDQLPVPYRIRNGRPATLGELLLVRGFDSSLLYGEDANRNRTLDEQEDDGAASLPEDDSDGRLRSGLESYLTVWGIHRAIDREGRLQVDLNRDVDRLAELNLSDDTLRYIARLRAAGQAHDPGAQVFRHPVDLLDARRRYRDRDGIEKEIHSGIGPAELEGLLDRSCAYPFFDYITFAVNVNTAPAAVLSRLPDVDEELARRIVQKRGDLPDDQRRTTAWLLRERLVDIDHFRRIAPRLVARGYQFRFQVVGYGLPGGQFCVLEAVVDVRDRRRPRLVYLRDLTRLGRPFSLAGAEGAGVAVEERRHG